MDVMKEIAFLKKTKETFFICWQSKLIYSR